MEMGCQCIMQNRNENVLYAGFFVRLVAFLVDSIVVGILMLFVKLPLGLFKIGVGTSFLFHDFFFQFSFVDILCYILSVGYFIFLTYSYGQTLGKKLLCIEVIPEDGEKLSLFTVIYRETIGRYLSGLLCIGYICIALDDKKRGFHDTLSDTYVVYKGLKKKTNQTTVEEFFVETI